MIFKYAEIAGADFTDVRCQEHYYELLTLDNGVVRAVSTSMSKGLGLRVLVEGRESYATIEKATPEDLKRAIENAVKLAKSMSPLSSKNTLASRTASKASVSSAFIREPEYVDLKDKVELLHHMYTSIKQGEIASVVLRYGYERDYRVYASSIGDRVEKTTRMIGIGLFVVAHSEGKYETLSDSKSSVAGWEFVENTNWEEYAKSRRKIVLEALEAEYVKPGKYDVVLDNEMVGLLLHEAFGHASEADAVVAGASVLEGRIGSSVASEHVTIVDEGVVENGAFVPYDDEGTPKGRTVIVEHGVLRGYLHGLATAGRLGHQPTGNARVMSYQHPILVRQTNIYMEPGDWNPDEMIRDTRRGLYVRAVGAGGGEVNPLTGAFTFVGGPSYVIENGEITRPVKGVMLSGLILEALHSVDAVGKDLLLRTSVFGGCGKMGQMVRVGLGGPHVRVRGMTVGGGQ